MKKWLLDPKMYIEFGIATLLYVANIVLTLLFPYFTEHKAYYDSTAYIVVLTAAYLLYAIVVHISRKKSASDIAVLTYAFFALWEVSYKTGLVKNDLLIPSPEGLFHVFVEKPAEIGSDILGSLSLLFWGFLLAIVLGTMLGLLAGWIPRIREVLLPLSNVITLIPAAYVFCLSDHDLFHLPSGSHRRNLLCCILADLPGNGGKSGTDRQVHY
ncbi:MAG: hypothetical protein V8Q57_05285 [Blautia sp.]